jgi:hypothetical protein
MDIERSLINTKLSRVSRHLSDAGPTWPFASTPAAERLDHQASTLKGKWKDRRRH